MELGVRKSLDVHEHVLTQSRKYFLSDLLQNYGLHIGGNKRYDKNTRIYGNVGKQFRHLKLLCEYLLYLTDKQGRDDLIGDRKQHDKANGYKAPPIGLRIFKESLYNFAILNISVKADSFLFVLHKRKGYNKDKREGTDYSAEYQKRIKFFHFQSSFSSSSF